MKQSEACSRVGNTKAPGLDGIPNIALKAAIKAEPAIFLDVYNKCLAEEGSKQQLNRFFPGANTAFEKDALPWMQLALSSIQLRTQSPEPNGREDPKILHKDWSENIQSHWRSTPRLSSRPKYDGLLKLELPKEVKLVAYADDDAVVVVAKHFEAITFAFDATIEKISHWMKTVGLQLAEHKTEAVLVTGRKRLETITLQVGAHESTSQPSLRYLGVMIDARLNFKQQAQHNNRWAPKRRWSERLYQG
ncbi:unnamed protein product [Arctia plantaginis]|uniref:Reverse transcriptase domain-containing protein n=1 Tax=Arctia plantaginis TaxID=874455 RepID=A0A8S1B773_ARCPL|nr:unnamed protein product [Arctia plantaginis]